MYLWENLREHNSYERFATKREVLKNIYAQPSQELVDYQTFTIQQPAFSGNLFQLDDFEPNTLVELTFKNATTINILSSMYNVNDDKVIPLFSLGYPVGNSFSENGENIVVLLSNTNQLSLHNIAVSTPNSYVLTLPSNDNNLSLIQQ
ncbi:MAG: hypothetical protein LBD75_01295 [Candidatus Peribacteria bacterium]|nr:hypothetical protein [Candidatus Peribacteria bacterium]